MEGEDDAAQMAPMTAEEKAEFDREREDQDRLLQERFERRLDEGIDQSIKQSIKQSINDRIYSVWD